MTDAGEKLAQRVITWWRENGESACNTDDLVRCVRAELERAAEIADAQAKCDYAKMPGHWPYKQASDTIAAAIRRRKE